MRSARLISGGDGLPGSCYRQLQRCGGTGSECVQCVPGPPPPPEQGSVLFCPKDWRGGRMKAVGSCCLQSLPG